MTTTEQALLLALIVLVSFHVWQNFGVAVATVADDGAETMGAADWDGALDGTDRGHGHRGHGHRGHGHRGHGRGGHGHRDRGQGPELRMPQPL